MGASQKLYKKAKKLIPGGTQLLSKRPEMFLPDLWPAYYEKAKGCRVWDLDGREYTDMSYMGIGACILGYADDDVDNAVKRAIDKGSMSTLNCPEETAVAELLCAIHPWADMARFARTGGEAMAIAVRIARARTDREIVLFCGYHGWHDWYLSANLGRSRSLDGHLLPGLEPKGVPRGLKNSAVPFVYDDTEGFLRLLRKFGNKVAAVVMEPVRNRYPEKGFLETIRKASRESGAVLIFDEITSGWRIAFGGAHLELGVNPDMAVFGKGMTNGYPMAAVIGKKDVMKACQETFISSTYWTERIGPVAALATIEKLKRYKAWQKLISTGRKVKEGWRSAAKRYGIDMDISGIDPLGHFLFKKDNLALKTFFTQEMMKKGFLATNAFYASLAHGEDDIEGYLDAAGKVFCRISKIIKEGRPEEYLEGPVCHSGFRRLN